MARLAADCGLDGLILGDGFVSTPSFPVWSGGVDCFVELAWLAGQVPMSTYGVDAIVLPARDPRVLAKQICSLKLVAGGTCHVALSAGYWREDAELFDYRFTERGARFDEGIRALLAAMRGDAFDGRFWSWKNATQISPCHEVEPAELWLSGAQATMRRALHYQLPWEPSRMSPGEVEPLAKQYFDSGGIGLKVRTRMCVEAPRENTEAFRTFSTLVGSAEYLAEQIDAYASLGATYISVVPGFDEQSCAETIEALGVAINALTT